LDQIGFRRQREIKFHLTSVNYTNCRAFHKEYLLQWWEILGQSKENVRESTAQHIPGTRGDLCLTYKLFEPVHLAKISNFPKFQFISPGAQYCFIHRQEEGTVFPLYFCMNSVVKLEIKIQIQIQGRLAMDPPTDRIPTAIIRPTYCCSRMETQTFDCTIMGRDDLYFRL
jgi:hypothetical protein